MTNMTRAELETLALKAVAEAGGGLGLPQTVDAITPEGELTDEVVSEIGHTIEEIVSRGWVLKFRKGRAVWLELTPSGRARLAELQGGENAD